MKNADDVKQSLAEQLLERRFFPIRRFKISKEGGHHCSGIFQFTEPKAV